MNKGAIMTYKSQRDIDCTEDHSFWEHQAAFVGRESQPDNLEINESTQGVNPTKQYQGGHRPGIMR